MKISISEEMIIKAIYRRHCTPLEENPKNLDLIRTLSDIRWGEAKTPNKRIKPKRRSHVKMIKSPTPLSIMGYDFSRDWFDGMLIWH